MVRRPWAANPLEGHWDCASQELFPCRRDHPPHPKKLASDCSRFSQQLSSQGTRQCEESAFYTPCGLFHCVSVSTFPYSEVHPTLLIWGWVAPWPCIYIYIFINILCLNVLHVRSSAPKHSLMFTFLQHGCQEHCEKGKGKTQPQQKAKEIGNLLNQSCQHFVRMAF